MSRLPAEEKVHELVSAYRRGDFPGAERLARGFTRKWPAHDLGWNILSASLHALGKLDKAANAYRRAIALNPRYAELRDNYGALLIQQGALEDAGAQFREAVRLDPGSGRSRANLALVLTMQGKPEEALEPARAAVAMDPDSASARNTLGNALRALGRLQEAREAYVEAIERNVHDAKAHCNLAGVLVDLGMAGEAEQHYRLALKSNPEYVKACSGLGNLLAMLGRMDEAEQYYRRALANEPRLAEAHRYLASIKTFRETDQDLRDIEALLADRSLPDSERAQLHYAAGKAYQDLGSMPERAFDHFARGAALRRREFRYDVADDETLMEETAGEYEEGSIQPPQTAASGGVTAVFIVGMPRSGTTLVEQILGAHPQVCPLGEIPALDEIVAGVDQRRGQRYPQWVGTLPASERDAIAAGYIDALRSRDPAASVFTDKTPENFRYLGLIAAALPGARIIHVMRSPMDTCLSCFTQYFSSHVPWSYDLQELGRFYRAYHALMVHWRRVLPRGMMMELAYEDLTACPEDRGREIIAHCGLEWHRDCLAFQDNRRLIQTASVAQARAEVSRASVGRWRQYETRLEALRDALGELAY